MHNSKPPTRLFNHWLEYVWVCRYCSVGRLEIYIHIYIYIHACMHACIYTCRYAYVYVYVWMCMCMYVCIYIYIYIYILQPFCSGKGSHTLKLSLVFSKILTRLYDKSNLIHRWGRPSLWFWCYIPMSWRATTLLFARKEYTCILPIVS